MPYQEIISLIDKIAETPAQEMSPLIEELAEKLNIDLRSELEKLEDTLGLERNVLLKFTEESDDWTFIIKTHAFVEAAVTHFLANYLGEEKLQAIFAHIELGNTKTGKIAFMNALGILENDEEHLLRQLSYLRNILVHNVSKIYFDLKKYITTLDKNQRKNFVRAFTYWKLSDIPDPKDEYRETMKAVESIANKIILTKPKTAIFLSVSSFIERLFARPEQRRREEEVQQKYVALKEKMRQSIEQLQRKISLDIDEDERG